MADMALRDVSMATSLRHGNDWLLRLPGSRARLIARAYNFHPVEKHTNKKAEKKSNRMSDLSDAR